ncbi:MAG: hypothetical protein MJE77_19900 [Proteobacteria bacterium]|nr:hypothetical protein [Pseudomonadota bacterium]
MSSLCALLALVDGVGLGRLNAWQRVRAILLERREHLASQPLAEGYAFGFGGPEQSASDPLFIQKDD